MSDSSYQSDLVETEESFQVPRRKPMQELKLDITPMIDVTFLLLIFFIVASKINAQEGANLPESSTGISVNSSQSVKLTMMPGGPEDRALVYKGGELKDDNLLPADNIQDQEDAIAAYVTAALNGELPGEGKKFQVIILVDKSLTNGEFERVSKAATISEEVQVERVFIGVKEEQ